MGHSTSIPIDAPRKFILVGRSFIVCNSWLRVYYEQPDVSYHYPHDAPFQIQMSSGHDNILNHVELQVMWDLLDGMLIRCTTAGATWGDGIEYFLLNIWTNLLQDWRLQIYIVKFLMMLWKKCCYNATSKHDLWAVWEKVNRRFTNRKCRGSSTRKARQRPSLAVALFLECWFTQPCPWPTYLHTSHMAVGHQ